MQPGELPVRCIIKAHWRLGRFGLMVTKERCDGRYGAYGSRGVTWHITLFADPRARAA